MYKRQLQNRVPTDVDARTDAVGSARQQSVQVPAFAAARVKQLLWRIRQQRVDGVCDRLIAPRREHALTGGKQRRVIECIRLRRKQINAPAPVHIHGVTARANQIVALPGKQTAADRANQPVQVRNGGKQLFALGKHHKILLDMLDK